MSNLIVKRMVEMGKVPGDVLRMKWVSRDLLEEHLVRSAAMDIQAVIKKEPEEIQSLILRHWQVKLPEDAKPDKLGRMPTVMDDVAFTANSTRLAKRMLGGEFRAPQFGRGLKQPLLIECYNFWCQKSGLAHKVVEAFADGGKKPSDLVTNQYVTLLRGRAMTQLRCRTAWSRTVLTQHAPSSAPLPTQVCHVPPVAHVPRDVCEGPEMDCGESEASRETGPFETCAPALGAAQHPGRLELGSETAREAPLRRSGRQDWLDESPLEGRDAKK